MDRSVGRAIVTASAGLAAGMLAVALAYSLQPGFVLEMDRAVPTLVSGMYGVERHADETFAWTGPRAEIRLPDADRRAPWTCTVRVRGARPPGVEQPTIALAVDGARAAAITATNEYQVVDVEAAPSETSGLTLTIQSTPPFVPSPTDTRELGAQVDRLACHPTPGHLALPPRTTILAGGSAGALFGLAFGMLAASTLPALLGTLMVAALQALPLSAGSAPYTAYPWRVTWLAAWIAVAMVVVAVVLPRWRGDRLSSAARFVIAFSGAALFAELLGLLHPSKPVVDALFHAHRLGWVLDGRYFFTQPMPSGVRFPYAIGLYVFASPWAALTTDHVALLRVVVSAVRALAGALIYPVVVRAWGDRRAGALAVVLCQFVPLPYVVIGNANLTFAFAQSAAQLTLAAAAAWRMQRGDLRSAAALCLLASAAFLSHVGIFPVLLVALLATAGAYLVFGDKGLRAPATRIAAAAVLAAILSVVAYYGHFREAYESLDRVRARAAGTAVAGSLPGASASAPSAQRAAADKAVPAARPLHVRTLDALGIGIRDIGWPTLLLAAFGLWRCAVLGARDRLGLAVAGMAIAYAGFLAFSVAAPVEPRFQRYTDEFISRLDHATMLAAVVLAGRGASWAWTTGLVGRVVTVLLGGAAVSLGAQRWLAWFL